MFIREYLMGTRKNEEALSVFLARGFNFLLAGTILEVELIGRERVERRLRRSLWLTNR